MTWLELRAVVVDALIEAGYPALEVGLPANSGQPATSFDFLVRLAARSDLPQVAAVARAVLRALDLPPCALVYGHGMGDLLAQAESFAIFTPMDGVEGLEPESWKAWRAERLRGLIHFRPDRAPGDEYLYPLRRTPRGPLVEIWSYHGYAPMSEEDAIWTVRHLIKVIQRRLTSEAEDDWPAALHKVYAIEVLLDEGRVVEAADMAKPYALPYERIELNEAIAGGKLDR